MKLSSRSCGRGYSNPTGEDANASAAAAKPDIVLMETALRGVDGIAATREITDSAPGTKVVMLASAADRDTMMKAYQAGGTSYLTKNEVTEDLGPALRMIHRGTIILSMPRVHRGCKAPRLQHIRGKRLWRQSCPSAQGNCSPASWQATPTPS